MRVERVRIPKERVAPAIGSDGEVRKRIEEETDVELDYDSKSGLVEIKSEKDTALGTMTARDVIKAIGRGFSPERAFDLFSESIYLDVVDVTRYSGKSKKKKSRLKGRVIGENGKTRRLIEEYTDTSLSIYGKTVACIGTSEKIQIAREAVNMLLDGAPHSAAYNFLEEKKREFEKPLDLWK